MNAQVKTIPAFPIAACCSNKSIQFIGGTPRFSVEQCTSKRPAVHKTPDVVRVTASQQGSSDRSEHQLDVGLSRDYRSSCNESNSRKKKCWHTHRRVTIRGSHERFFGDETGVGDIAQDHPIESEVQFLSVTEQMRLSVQLELTSEQLSWLEEIDLRASASRSFERYIEGSLYRRPSHDLISIRGCTCSTCMGDHDFYGFDDSDPRADFYFAIEEGDEVADIGSTQEMIDRFGDRDETLSDFGNTDSDMDSKYFGQCSSGRFSYRFRGLSLRKQEALQR